jgi:hypothetical protein
VTCYARLVRLLVTAALLLSLAPGIAEAQDDEETGEPIVLVVDGAGSRLSVARLVRTLEAVLSRPILRPADDGAADATATLTVAFSGPRHWVVRFDEGGSHPSRSMDVRGPALEMIVGMAIDAVREGESATSAPPPPATAAEATARLTGEILDPFVGMPISRITIAVVGELIDPFSHLGGGVRVIGSPEVLDPWR